MKNNLSVIIPSLGSGSLYDVLNNLLLSSLVPEEIIVCVPYLSNFDFKKINHKNIIVIQSNIKSQVVQRLLAFRRSTKKYVMQLDDDVFLHKNAISNLLAHCLSSKKGSCFAPIYLNKNNSDKTRFIHSYGYQFNKNYKKILFNILFYYLHNLPFDLKKMGKVSDCGVPFGVALQSKNIDLIEVDWLPGGCVIQDRKNFINYDYYKLSGKAYTEDIACSYIRKSKNIFQYVSSKSIAYIESSNKNLNLNNKNFFRNLYEEFISRKYYIKLTNKSLIKFYLWMLIYFLKKIVDYELFKIKMLIWK